MKRVSTLSVGSGKGGNNVYRRIHPTRSLSHSADDVVAQPGGHVRTLRVSVAVLVQIVLVVFRMIQIIVRHVHHLLSSELQQLEVRA